MHKDIICPETKCSCPACTPGSSRADTREPSRSCSRCPCSPVAKPTELCWSDSCTGLTAQAPSYTGPVLPKELSKKSKQTHSFPGFGRFKIRSDITQPSRTAQGAQVSHPFLLFSSPGFRSGAGQGGERTMFPYMELLPGRFINPQDLKGAKLFPQRYIDASKRQSGAGDGAHRNHVSIRSRGLAGTPIPERGFWVCLQGGCFFPPATILQPCQNKGGCRCC